MPRVIIQTPSLNQTDSYDVTDIHAFLYEQYPEGLTPNTKIYTHQVAAENEVVFNNEQDIIAFGYFKGDIYIVNYPGVELLIKFVITTIINTVLGKIFAPDAPEPARNTQPESPNEALGDRTNQPRLGGAYPWPVGENDIFPDLWMDYKIFEDNIEKEVFAFLVGVGKYQTTTNDIFDGETKFIDTDGQLALYPPNNSPLQGSPQLTIGDDITNKMYAVRRNNSVNGQTLRAPNEPDISGDFNIKFQYPNKVIGTGVDFTESFAAGGGLIIANAEFNELVESTAEFLSDDEVFEDFGYTSTPTVKFLDGGQIEYEDPFGNGNQAAANLGVGDYILIRNAQFLYLDLTDDSDVQLTGDIDVDFTNQTAGLGTLQIDSDVALFSDTLVIDLSGAYLITAKSGNLITLEMPEAINSDWGLLDTFVANETPSKMVQISKPQRTRKIDLAGEYTVAAVTVNEITLVDPANGNFSWSNDGLGQYLNDQTSFQSPTLSTGAAKWLGEFTLQPPTQGELYRPYLNYVAANGLYKDDGRKQQQIDIEVEVEIVELDDDGNDTAPKYYLFTVYGSATNRRTRQDTQKDIPVLSNEAKVRIRRNTLTDFEFNGNVVDELKLRDLYAMGDVNVSDFGDVTMGIGVTSATETALAVKQRKLTIRATSVLEVDGVETATKNAGDIIKAISLHPDYGNRSIDELDLDNISATIADMNSYFGTSLASEFSHTFSSDNLSYEEMMYTIAEALHCVAYRSGIKLKLSFERKREIPKLLFNHRNKVPRTEQRQETFGYVNDYDGVEVEWKNPETKQVEIYRLPEGAILYNPQKVQVQGLRNKVQAHFHASRVWNRLRYAQTVVTFDALEEANLLIDRDYILVADNTRPETQDGEIVCQNGLVLELSNPVLLEPNLEYHIFLQLSDATVESIPVTAITDDEYSVNLAHAPAQELVTDHNKYLKTTYQIVTDSNVEIADFMVRDINKQSRNQFGIEAVKIDPRFWQNDTDFIDGNITN